MLLAFASLAGYLKAITIPRRLASLERVDVRFWPMPVCPLPSEKI
jgi:hypothetical protein